MKTLMVATTNEHKVEEFKQILGPLGYKIMSLLDLEEKIDIIEDGTTFEENALMKARVVYKQLGIAVISDDSGLSVNAMDGAPGVHSARFLGYDTNYNIKNQYILDQVKEKGDRGAKFICAIAYINECGEEYVFTGSMEGEIAYHIEGAKGFGYDPIFYYPPFTTTLANVSEEQKNSHSHRGRALAKLIKFIGGQ